MNFTPVPVYGSKAPALVDVEDLPLVSGFKWYLNSEGYATTTFHRRGCSRKDLKRNTNLSMARVIMCDYREKGKVIDHISGVRLDNRKSNLRWATYTQNSANAGKVLKSSTSIYKGVSYCFRDRVWSAHCARFHLGNFSEETIAAAAVDKAARHFYGAFAYINLPHLEFNAPLPHVDFSPKVIGTSSHIGVSFYKGKSKRRKRWRAIYKKHTIGYYLTEQEAINAYVDYTRNIR